METNSPRPIKFLLSESELLEIYNQVPRTLTHQVMGVGITPESLSSQSSVFLQKQSNGNYWIIRTDGNQYWLLPKGKKTFNSHEYSTLESLFECQGYYSEGGRDFIVKKPAKVISNSNEKDWKLEEKGVLDFIEFSPLTELKTKIEQAQQEREYLLSKLQVTEKELAETKDKLSQSENECHKLRSRLKTSEEERRQILSLSRNLQNQVNQQQQERQHLWDLLTAERQKKENLQSQFNEISLIANKGVQLKSSSESPKFTNIPEKIDTLSRDLNTNLEDITERLERLETKPSDALPQKLTEIENDLTQIKDTLNKPKDINTQDFTRQLIEAIKSNPDLMVAIAAAVRSQQGGTSKSLSEKEKLPRETSISESPDPLVLTEEEKQVVKYYNNGADLPSIDVSPTQDTVEEARTGRDQITYLKPDQLGMYWIIRAKEGTYLVPNRNRKPSTHRMNSVQDLFDCHYYQAGTTDPKFFQLVKPGKVASEIIGETWVLQSKGILEFQ